MKALITALVMSYIVGAVYAFGFWDYSKSRLPAAVCLLWPLWLLRELGRALRDLWWGVR